MTATLADTLGTVVAAMGHIDTLSSAERNAALAKFETEKATLEAMISVGTLADTADLLQEKGRIQARIDMLAARSELGEAASRWLHGDDANPPSVG